METQDVIIFVVDDDSGVRELMLDSLEHHGFRVQAFDRAAAFLAAYNSEQAGCLVLDLSMPDMNGLELQQELIRRDVSIPIIFITGNADIPQTVQALKAGAVDFLEKPFRQEVLLQRIEEALSKDQKIRAEKNRNESIKSRFERLTARELDVLRLLVSGTASLSNKAIARKLDISHRTVDHHRARIMEKTGTHSITELARLAHQAGFEEVTQPG